MAARTPDDDGITHLPSFAAYDAKRTAWEAESDPAAKRVLLLEKHTLSDALYSEKDGI